MKYISPGATQSFTSIKKQELECWFEKEKYIIPLSAHPKFRVKVIKTGNHEINKEKLIFVYVRGSRVFEAA